MENQPAINMLGITNQQVYNNRRDINNLMELWTDVRDQLSGSSSSTTGTVVYNPMRAELRGGDFSIIEIQDLQAKGSGTFGGTLNVTGATALGSTLTVTGATNLNNNLTVTHPALYTNTTPANGFGGGAHQIKGGASVALDFYIGQDLNVAGNSILTGTLDASGVTTINNNTSSTNSTNGALTVAGGVGIAENLNVGGSTLLDGTLGVTLATTLSNNLEVSGIIKSSNTGDATSTGPNTSSTAVQLSGGMSVAKSIYISNNLYINQNASITGNLTVDNNTTLGNAAGDNLTVKATSAFSADAEFAGRVHISNTTNSAGTASGALQVDGGVGIAQKVYIGGILYAQNTTQSTSTNSGAIQVTGGVGIAKKLTVGGDITSNGNITCDQLSASGAASFASSIQQAGNTNTAGFGALSGHSLTITTTANVQGNTTLAATTCTSSLNVVGATVLGTTAVDSLTVTNSTTLNNTLAVTSATTLSNTLAVTSEATFSDNLIVTKKVGIGTTSPQRNLHIHCDSNNEGILLKGTGNTSHALTMDANRSSAGGALGEVRGLWNGTEVARIVLRGGDDTTNKDDGKITFSTSSANNISQRMIIRADGGVGIGHGGYTSTLLSLHNGTGRDTIIYGESGDANCNISLRDNSSSQNIVYGATGNNHVFKKDGTEMMRIDGSGNVGINKTNPDRRLHVEDTATATVAKFANTGNVVYIELNAANQAGADAGYIRYDNNKDMSFWTDDTERVTVKSDGTVDLKVAKLQLNGSSGSAGQVLATNGTNVFWSGAGGGFTGYDEYYLTSDLTNESNAIITAWTQMEKIGTGMTLSSGKFAFPETGYWLVCSRGSMSSELSTAGSMQLDTYYTENDFATELMHDSQKAAVDPTVSDSARHIFSVGYGEFLVNITNTSTHKIRLRTYVDSLSGYKLVGGRAHTRVSFKKVG